MAETFRQEVEEIFCEALCPESDWENCKIKDSCALKKVTCDSICSAAKRRLGDGMPEVDFSPGTPDHVCAGQGEMREIAIAHITKECAT